MPGPGQDRLKGVILEAIFQQLQPTAVNDYSPADSWCLDHVGGVPGVPPEVAPKEVRGQVGLSLPPLLPLSPHPTGRGLGFKGLGAGSSFFLWWTVRRLVDEVGSWGLFPEDFGAISLAYVTLIGFLSVDCVSAGSFPLHTIADAKLLR